MFQYEPTTYGRNRDTGRTNSTTDRPTTVTAKYMSPTSSYKTSSIPVLCNDRSTREETPISTVASRYASYNKADKINKYDKKDFNKLSVPTTTTSKTRDVSPVSISAKYGLSRTSRHISPDRRTTKSLKEKKNDAIITDRDKDIPSKTDKSAGYSSLSSYKLYPRSSSYTRTPTRAETKPEVTVNRYAIASRLSTSYLKSPTLVKRTSVSPVNVNDSAKVENGQHEPVLNEIETKSKSKADEVKEKDEVKEIENNNEIETINVVTRHTSPTPPGSSAYVRSRRAELAKTIEKTISRSKKRPEMVHKEIQSDRLDDSTRSSRFGSTSRTSLTNWSYYSPTSHNYTGYAGRYSTQYSNLRDNSSINNYEKNSRISSEPLSKDNSNHSIHLENYFESDRIENTEDITTNSIESPEYNNSLNECNNSDIVVNVNLKLKKVKDTSAELSTPEITLTNSNLPPQAPKQDGPQKVKKNKVRKSSTDSSSDSTTKKKVVKKRSKSVSSTDSEQSNDTNKNKGLRVSSSSKILSNNVSSTNLQNGPVKLAQSKSRESNSPESSITLSTQSSVSEEESNLKSNCNEIRSPMCDDKIIKQASPVRTIKNDGGTEEAKSFLIRALAPVTNLFKLKHQDSFENVRNDRTSFISDNNIISKSKNNSENIIASNDNGLVKLKSIRPIESQDRKWWLDSDDVESSKQQREMVRQIESSKELQSEKQIPQLNVTESVESMKPLKKYLLCDDEKPWWLDSSANIPEGIQRLTPPRKSSSDSDKSDKGSFLKTKSNDLDERKDWRMSNSGSCSQINLTDNQSSLSRSNSEIRNFPLRRIRHVESGERPWWLSSTKNIPEGIEKLPPPTPEHGSDSSDSEDGNLYMASELPPFPLHLPDDEPLGVRKSPEGLETPGNEMFRGRISPYENYQYFRKNSNQVAYQKYSEKFISRFTDIDDILGTSGQIYSPFMDSILARRTGHMAFEDDDCEEIDPTQVRIHDSTAQIPVIKKLPCR